MTEVFGVRLSACRQIAGLSQEELAQRSGLSIRAVRNLERGRTRWPYPESVRRLADALELSGPQRDEFISAADRRLVSAAGGVPETVENRSPQVVPHQLPAPVRHFVGRAGELKRLSALAGETAGACPAVVISAIGGMAGVGKTALAVHFAHQVADRFPDGQLYVNLGGYDAAARPVPAAEAIAGFLDVLGVDPRHIPADLAGQAALYRTLLAGRQVLVVLDNARDASQVRPLLPGSAGCLVIVTSRNELAGLAAADGAQLVTLDVLPEADAAGLLAARLGAHRVQAEPMAAAGLTRLCGRLPLALAIAAARAAARPAHPLAALAAELSEGSGLLDALDAGEPAASTRAVFSWSYRHLSIAAARMFRLLGIHPGPGISVAAAASLAGITPARARGVMRELTAASLLTENAPGRYVLHDLLRCYAAELASHAEESDDRRAATRRMLDHYLHTANGLLGGGWRALELAEPERGVTPEAVARADYLAWFDAEYKILLMLAGDSAASGFDSYAWQLPWTMAPYLDRRGYWDDWAAAQQAALAAARRAGDEAGQARACHSLGQACVQLCRHEDGRAHLQRALELYAELEDREGQAHVHLCYSVAADRQHRYPEALANSKRALDLLGSGGKQDLRATALNDLGHAYALVGDYEQALIWCEQARGLQHELGIVGEADTWDSMGYAHQRLGHYSQAVDCYQRALHLHSVHGFKYDRGRTYVRLGDAHYAAGKTAAARDAWQHALTTFEELHHTDAAGVRAKLHSLAEEPDHISVWPDQAPDQERE